MRIVTPVRSAAVVSAKGLCAMMVTRHKANAFTLIEVLVSISILAILIAILVPALGQARSTARELKSHANIRSHAQVLATYTTDWQEHHFYFYGKSLEGQRVDTDLTDLDNPNDGPRWSFFRAYNLWDDILIDDYYDGNPIHNTFYRPGHYQTTDNDVTRRTSIDRGGAAPGLSSYFYSAALLAQPEYWTTDQRIGSSQWRGTFAHEVRFPSSKAAFVEWSHLSRPQATRQQDLDAARTNGLVYAMIDGSSGRYKGDLIVDPLSEAAAVPVQSIVQQLSIQLTDFWPASFGLHTPRGVHGRDLNR